MKKITDKNWAPFDGPINNPEEAIAKRYALQLDEELCDFMDYVRNTGTRDALPDWSVQRFISERALAKNSLADITKLSKSIEDLINELTNRIIDFEDQYEYNPTLMDAVTEANLGEPNDLFPDSPLNALQHYQRAAELRHNFVSQLRAISKIPILRSDRGRVSNTTLKRAVGACRHFWQETGRGWTSDNLADHESEWAIADLSSDAERFVADVLRVSGFDFTFDELQTSWRHWPKN